MPEVTAFKLRSDEIVKLALRPEQAADALSVSVTFLYREIKAGKIAVIKKGHGPKKVTLITIQAITDYLNKSDADIAIKPNGR